MARIKLEDIALEMNQQNHRGTQFPIFVIQEKQKVVTHEDHSEYTQHYGDGYLEMDEDDLCEDCQMVCGMAENTDDLCPTCGYLCSYPVKEDWVFNLHHGVFLTGRECNEYIAANKHHFSGETRSFAIGTKSEQMQNVLEHISSISPSGLEGHYRIF